MRDNKKKIVIIGGGIAGLSAGIYGKLEGMTWIFMRKIRLPAGSVWDGTGKTAILINWRGLTKEEYEKQKKEAVKAIEERLLTQFPKLRGHMEFLDCWTLVTYERYCNAYHGAYMSFITKKGVKPFRVKGIIKGVKNLYIASQWIMAPGGLFVAVTSGKFAVWRIARKDKRKM